jgi:hypothetical protein
MSGDDLGESVRPVSSRALRRDAALAVTTPTWARVRLGVAALLAIVMVGLSVAAWGLRSDVDKVRVAARRVERIAPTVSQVAKRAATATSDLVRVSGSLDSLLGKADALASEVTKKSSQLEKQTTSTQKTLGRVKLASGLLGADGLSSSLGKLDGYLSQASGAANTVHETSSSLHGTIPSSLSPAIAATLNQAAKTFTDLGAAADNAEAKAGQVADNASSWWTVLFVALVIVAIAALANLGWRIWLHRRWRVLRHTRAEALVIDAIAALTPTPSAHTS